MRKLLLITCLLCAHAAHAEDAQPLSLKQAQDMALANHPQIRSEALKLRAAKQDVKVARAGYFPQASGDAVRAFASSKTQLSAQDTGITNSSVINRGAYGVSASQLITDFGRTGSRVEAARASADAQSARADDTRERVLLEVTRAYYNALRAQALERVAEDTAKARAALLDQASSLRQAGQRSDLDVSIAKQNVSDAALLQLRAKNDEDDAMATLSQTLGFAGQQHFSLSDDTPVTAPPADVEPLIAQAMDQNPELRSLKAQAQAAHRTAEAAQAANYPTVSAVGFAGETPIRASNTLDSHYSAAGVMLNIPIFTGGRLTAAGQSAEFGAEASEQEVIDRQNALAHDIRVAWNSVQAAYKNIDVTKDLQTSAKESLELTQARYELGKSSIVDLAQVQLLKTQADIGSANASYDYLIQLALLQYDIGGGALPAGTRKTAEGVGAAPLPFAIPNP